MKEKSQYENLGVDPHKTEVKRAFSRVVNNDFPGAFCNIFRDPKIPGQVLVKHPDGDGSKFMQRILHYLETRDEEIFQGAVDDALSMNTGDIAAAGFVFGDMFLTDIIAVNGFNAPKNVIMGQLSARIASLLRLYRTFGFNLIFMGGETADLPGQVQSFVFDMDIFARAQESDVISGNIQPGDIIYGFASDGKAVWENGKNSGIMSNGITLARIALIDNKCAEKYPFLCQTGKPYRGRYGLNDQPDILEGMTVSQAILSPTRQWAIVIRLLIEKLKKKNALHLLHGISMNTGGGATKVSNLGRGIVFNKKMPVAPPIFKLIQAESGEDWKNMYTAFNCGVGIDVIGSPEGGILAEAIQTISVEAWISYYELGKCEASPDGKNRIILINGQDYREFTYSN
jgi:phosphoribosylformylglycinamidine cyclo-ligase